MLVYRVATPNRNTYGIPSGPYCDTDASWEDDMAQAHTDVEHPSPHRDKGLGDIYSFEFCAFESMASLKSWFEGWIDLLSDSGYLVHVYDVPENRVRRGARQVVAQLREGALIRTESLVFESPCANGAEEPDSSRIPSLSMLPMGSVHRETDRQEDCEAARSASLASRVARGE